MYYPSWLTKNYTNDSTNNWISFAPLFDTECAIFHILSPLTFDFSQMLHFDYKFRMLYIARAQKQTYERLLSAIQNVIRVTTLLVCHCYNCRQWQAACTVYTVHMHILWERASIFMASMDTWNAANAENIVVSFAKHTIR